jgi:hypothetical protein
VNGGSNVSCSANISSYTVTPSASGGGTINPSSAYSVTAGTTASFTVTATSGYTINSAVTGSCPQGSWNGGSTSSPGVWTTGAITNSCSVIFGFTPIPANSWFNLPSPTILRDTAFTLDVIAKSDSVKVGSYVFTVTFDPSKLVLDTSYQNASGQCSQGVCPGAQAVANRTNFVNDEAGSSITLNGSDASGVGPGNDLQLLVMHFKTKLVTGATPVTLTTTRLATPAGGNIGLTARSATVNVSYGLCGDADGNTSVNIVDALAIARKVVGLNPPPTVDVTLADVDKNGIASIVDAMHIARYAVGLVTPPEVCVIGQPL